MNKNFQNSFFLALLLILAVFTAQARITGNQSADIQAMQDSIRYRVGTGADFKIYEKEIINYYQASNNLTTLEQYAATIVDCNRPSYYTFHLYLMNYYRSKGLETNAQYCKNALLLPNPNDPEIKCNALFFDYIGQNKGSNKSFTASDSITLTYIAQSGTSVAPMALKALKKRNPRLSYDTKYTYSYKDTVRCINMYARREVEDGNTIQTTNQINFSIYPNPASYFVSLSKSQITLNNYFVTFIENGTGKKVKNINWLAAQQILGIDARSLSAGVYQVNIADEHVVVFSRKLVVE